MARLLWMGVGAAAVLYVLLRMKPADGKTDKDGQADRAAQGARIRAGIQTANPRTYLGP